MKIIVIHDDRREDKYRVECERELERQQIQEYSFWQANYIGETVHAAINQSHKQLVATASALGWEELCIMESDVQFPAPDGWQYFLNNKPAQGRFDLYLAGTYGEVMFSKELGFYTGIPAGFHCYIIASRYYDTFLATPADQHIDSAQRGGIYRLCYPFAAIQRPGWSANAKKLVDYNATLSRNDVYGWS